MHPIEVNEISKSFGDVQAVVDVSFSVRSGEIFGLLGPNGAGKTTAIRIMLDIFQPDQGQVSVLGGPMTEDKKNRIGYMPEERGLYQDVQLERCLLYLSSLKNVPDQTAQEKLGEYLERFDLAEHKNKKIKELSKGMQQKAQIINTLLHQPELIIIDEPFTALDPINLELVKDVMEELRDQGVTIIMSTHQMQQVEELCDRILLINDGKNLLYGEINDIRKRFSGHAVLVRTEDRLPDLSGVKASESHNGDLKLTLMDNTSPQDILKALAVSGIELERFEVAVPALNEIFIRVVEEGEGK
jgi:ABC-2 type transport system ATP-binding protein